MPDAQGRKVLRIGPPKLDMDEMLNALYVSLYHNRCGLRIDAASGNPLIFEIESKDVIGEFPGVAPHEIIRGPRRIKNALDEMQYLLEHHGYAFVRGNLYGARVLLLCEILPNGTRKPVAQIGQIIPDREHPGKDGIDYRKVGEGSPFQAKVTQ